jgi:ABC-type dipeptide/oligopeptide/nickel transport system permease component
MGTYIVRRILQAILILFGLSIVFFLILHLTPGGPCQAFEGQGFAAAAKGQACTWNGLGYLYIHSINTHDYPTIQAPSMIAALAVLMSNLLTDLTYAWVDPRIR